MGNATVVEQGCLHTLDTSRDFSTILIGGVQVVIMVAYNDDNIDGKSHHLCMCSSTNRETCITRVAARIFIRR